MKTLTIILATAAILAGCTARVTTAPEGLPQGSKTVSVTWGTAYVIPLKLDDGTRCVVTMGDRSSNATCDFTGAK